MTPADLSRLSTLLDEALDLPLPEREAWLATLEGEAATLAPTMRKLLTRQATKEIADMLERGPAFTLPAGVDTPATAFHPGDTVDSYRWLRALAGAAWAWSGRRKASTVSTRELSR